jgi:hypothetical protein
MNETRNETDHPFIGVYVGKRKGRKEAAEWLTILLGVVGLIIVLCLPESREAKIAEAQRQMEIQAEAARRAGTHGLHRLRSRRQDRRHGRQRLQDHCRSRESATTF